MLIYKSIILSLIFKASQGCGGCFSFLLLRVISSCYFIGYFGFVLMPKFGYSFDDSVFFIWLLFFCCPWNLVLSNPLQTWNHLFGLVIWHINHCWLFIAEPCFYIYIECIKLYLFWITNDFAFRRISVKNSHYSIDSAKF